MQKKKIDLDEKVYEIIFYDKDGIEHTRYYKKSMEAARAIGDTILEVYKGALSKYEIKIYTRNGFTNSNVKQDDLVFLVPKIPSLTKHDWYYITRYYDKVLKEYVYNVAFSDDVLGEDVLKKAFLLTRTEAEEEFKEYHYVPVKLIEERIKIYK